VKIRYQTLRPGWGQHPGRVAFTGLVQAVVFGAFAYFGFYIARAESELDGLDDQQRKWVGLVGLIVAIGCSLLVVSAISRVVIGVADLVPRRTIEGEVVRRRTYKSLHRLPRVLQWMIYSGRDQHGMNRDMNRRTKYHLAIDDGTDDRIVAYTVDSDIYRLAPQGARVRVKVSPLLGYVSRLEVTAPPPRSAASEPGVLHPLVEETATAAAGAAAGKLGEALTAAESMTDESGRPLLDQTDDEGVTLRERLAQSTEQLDRMRSDPRIANSPLAGIFDALGGGDEAPPDSPDANEPRSHQEG
jgi:hypothetical protein